MNCQRNINSTLPTQLPHKFSYIVAILGHNHFESPNICLFELCLWILKMRDFNQFHVQNQVVNTRNKKKHFIRDYANYCSAGASETIQCIIGCNVRRNRRPNTWPFSTAFLRDTFPTCRLCETSTAPCRLWRKLHVKTVVQVAIR
jgi:hypothetical protein